MAARGLAVLLVLSALCCVSSETLLGGWRPANTSSPLYTAALRFLELDFNKAHNGMYAYRVWSVGEAKQQLVNGMNYQIPAHLRRTVCRNQQDSEAGSCAFAAGDELLEMKCTYKINVSFEGKTSLMKKECNAV